MSEPKSDPRRYHHGDLRRALIDAARKILEVEGPSALSLRGVAREAGVSAAAPYHHFKDKAELLDAVSREGWRDIRALMVAAKAEAPPAEAAAAVTFAYVVFARDNPALYRVMYEMAKAGDAMSGVLSGEDNATPGVLRQTMIEAGADPADPLELALATAASWCAAHGLAELAALKAYDPLKAAIGGEHAFLRGVLGHLAVFPVRRR